MNDIFEQTVSEMISNFEWTEHEWYNGTLFYKCESECTARTIWHYLVEKFGLANLRMSKVGQEYAIDFV